MSQTPAGVVPRDAWSAVPESEWVSAAMLRHAVVQPQAVPTMPVVRARRAAPALQAVALRPA